MKPIKSLLILALVLAPAVASAQGYYARGPVEGGFHNRTGRLSLGFSLGLGFMNEGGSRVQCDNCSNPTPLAGELNFHVGLMMSPRFALLFEAQGDVQTIHSDQLNGDTTLTQGAAMIAGQYWVTPIVWIKGGVGLAHLSIDQAVWNGSVSQPVSDGIALMGAVGVELLSARFFALDLQGRLIEGSYDSISDRVTAGTIGIGLNWY